MQGLQIACISRMYGAQRVRDTQRELMLPSLWQLWELCSDLAAQCAVLDQPITCAPGAVEPASTSMQGAQSCHDVPSQSLGLADRHDTFLMGNLCSKTPLGQSFSRLCSENRGAPTHCFLAAPPSQVLVTPSINHFNFPFRLSIYLLVVPMTQLSSVQF